MRFRFEYGSSEANLDIWCDLSAFSEIISENAELSDKQVSFFLLQEI
jgi:hypothetical protein